MWHNYFAHTIKYETSLQSKILNSSTVGLVGGLCGCGVVGGLCQMLSLWLKEPSSITLFDCFIYISSLVVVLAAHKSNEAVCWGHHLGAGKWQAWMFTCNTKATVHEVCCSCSMKSWSLTKKDAVDEQQYLLDHCCCSWGVPARWIHTTNHHVKIHPHLVKSTHSTSVVDMFCSRLRQSSNFIIINNNATLLSFALPPWRFMVTVRFRRMQQHALCRLHGWMKKWGWYCTAANQTAAESKMLTNSLKSVG